MDMEIRFPGGKKVDALFKGFTIRTDQGKEDGGDNSAPTPFALFLASIGTCIGSYAYFFCESRGFSTEKLRIGLDFQSNPKSYQVERVMVRIGLPPDFPPKYHAALLRSVGNCFVKKHLDRPPVFDFALETAA